MKTLMNELLESLRKRIADNLATVRNNEQEIRKILKEPLSNQRSYNLSNRQAVSKKILQENAENLKIQNMIVAFLSNYKDIPEYTELLGSIKKFELGLTQTQNSSKEKSAEIRTDKFEANTQPADANSKLNKKIVTEDASTPVFIEKIADKIGASLFELTATGKLAYNRAHPKFNDPEFFDKLMNYHIEKEEYEMCAKLQKTRKY